MKKLFIMMFGLLFVASATFASPSANGDMMSMSKTDSQVLFGDSSVNVVALNSDEMKATEGEGFKWVYNTGRFVYKNTYFDGYNGSRIFQIRWRKRPVFRLDYKANPSPTMLHMHFNNMKYHRPWYAPWRKY